MPTSISESVATCALENRTEERNLSAMKLAENHKSQQIQNFGQLLLKWLVGLL